MIQKRPRVVSDCNVFVQALASETGPAAQALRLLETGKIELYVSRVTIRELRDVLQYPTIRAKNAHLTDDLIAAFLERLLFKASFIRAVRRVFDYPRARQDEPYIDLAAAVKAQYLVSRDKDLLSLASGYSQPCKQFRRLTHPMRVLDPSAFLRELKA